MLSLYDSLTNDERANRIIRRFVSDRILEIIQFEIDLYEFGMLDDLEKYSPDDDSLYYAITEDISPVNVSIEDANEAFLFLVRLLKSDQELEPSILQEYQMFQLIGGYCDIAKDAGLEIIERFPAKDRDTVLKALECIAGDAECSAEEVIDNYENINNYETI